MSKALALLPTPKELSQLSKKELVSKAKKTGEHIIESGLFNPLDVYIRAKKIVEFGTALGAVVKPKAEDEARKEQSKGVFEKFGATVTHTSSPAKYSYENCDDPTLERLEKALKEADIALKNRQKYLQGLPESGVEYVDPETGSVHTLRRPAKFSSESISISY